MTLEDYLKHLKALSTLTRFRIPNLLYQQKNTYLYQHEIVTILEITKSNISRHCKILATTELVNTYKSGKHVYYSLNPFLKPKSILNIIEEFQIQPILKQDINKLKALKLHSRGTPKASLARKRNRAKR